MAVTPRPVRHLIVTVRRYGPPVLEAPRTARRRWLWAGAIIVVVLILGGVIVRQFVLDDSARVVTTEEALSRFHASSSVPGPSSVTTAPPTTEGPSPSAAATSGPLTTLLAVGLPEAGVYQYGTIGRETIDVLNGAAHDYPTTTTMTVTPDGCGIRLRWDALRERRDEWQLCVTPEGIEVTAALQFHEFFQQPREEAVVCPAPVLWLPRDPHEGQSWSAECTLDGHPWHQQFDVIDRAPVTVGSTTVSALHIRQAMTAATEFSEHTTVDWWLSNDGLPLRMQATKASRSPSPVGAVNYEEHVGASLESVQPLR
jgi:hypothetical protein